MYAQVIDDTQSHTLISASTLDADVQAAAQGKDKAGQAAAVGEVLARRAQTAGIKQVVFDRGGYRYHGRVKSLAEAARKAGLEF
jgi:large subunit ribosomal protein L18